MNKYTLKFKAKEIEEKYQAQSQSKNLKPLFYALLIMAMSLNIFQLAINAQRDNLAIPYINMGFIIICLVGLYVMYKIEGLTAKIITITNAYSLSLQYNFSANTQAQEYYLYGCNFSLIQAVIYFSTDFHLSCPSLLLHIIFRQTSTILLTNKIDIQSLSLSMATAILITCVLYMCNKAYRIQFLMNYQQDTINNQLHKLINKPFSKIWFNEKKLQIDVQTTAFYEQFEQYTSDLCTGCNIRSFIRSCEVNNMTLEQALISGQVKFYETFEVKLQRKKIKIRLCQYNIDNSIILIQESVQKDPIQYKKVSKSFQQSLFKQFNAIRMTPQNQQFKFGTLSLLMLRQFQIKTINIRKLIRHLMSIYLTSKKVRLNFNGDYTIKIRTYGHLIKIFLIQVFCILQDLEYQQNYLEEINILNLETYMQIKLTIMDQYPFYPLYLRNYFIEQTAPYLLLNPLTYNLEFQFSKILPFNDFNVEC
ncbi:unnamed protein product (macronuclear) [Paramecium tetraurelia]|uniref:Transmembrane protein n=1 Tax=Paramecium tetraurelia TaxID=5888 RepID=A0ECR5_PARTE|nr:uncharacterized protein GSPATT00003951001 [Paramecium tetraurelia]CAK93082.1 unnamed protein product [Paramecium tetraurelia]|eukprot:XP_001460479.1 hypothetical protein (macronuclear) [Paramecium tetraurelia strain d4-2]